MPPSRHSSSSHSSSSRSVSSHSSSSHSSSSSRSHSSGGYTRHSSTSHSSGSGASNSGGSRSSYVRSGSPIGNVIRRERTGQPQGYRAKIGANAPTTHYCISHNYVYYPQDWTDESTGTAYRRGYYDEQGKYYEDVIFKKDNRYENVLCRCPYCNALTKITWRDGEPLVCKNCGGTLEMLSSLDEYTQDPGYTNRTARTKTLSRGASNAAATGIFIAAAAIIAAAGFFIFKAEDAVPAEEHAPISAQAPVSNTEIFGTTLYLTDEGEGTFSIAENETASWDRKLTWDYGAQSYYDPVSDCYVWYNTDVSPNLWQYWYEGISSDFGDFGWMEYEPDGWYIERAEGDWIPLPDKYDASALWHFPAEGTDS